MSGRLALLIANCVVLVAAVIQTGSARQAGKPQIPQSCAGIKVGVANDADVQKLYGKGYFVANESHAGGRYYVDPGHRVTLHVEIGVDRIIDGLEYREGMQFPGKSTAQMLKAAETARLTGNEKVDGALPLGATMHDVRARYGKPTHDSVEDGRRTLAYNLENPSSGGYDVNFVFRKDRLVRVLFDVGD